MHAPTPQPFDASDPHALAAHADNQLEPTADPGELALTDPPLPDTRPDADRRGPESVMLHPSAFSTDSEQDIDTPSDLDIDPLADGDPLADANEAAPEFSFRFARGAVVALRGEDGNLNPGRFLVLEGTPLDPLVKLALNARGGGYGQKPRWARIDELVLVKSAPSILGRSAYGHLLRKLSAIVSDSAELSPDAGKLSSCRRPNCDCDCDCDWERDHIPA